MARVFTLKTPLGDELKFRNLSGEEALSKVFEFRVEAISEKSNIALNSLLGKPVTVDVELVGGTRHLNALVKQARMLGRYNDRHYLYELNLSPWLWLASRRSDFKIFQNKTIPDIIKEVLAPYGYPIENKLIESYRSWEYCVQYSESDLAFVSRMMEHEGIYYYFEHQAGSHTMVLCDDICAHSTQAYAVVPFYNPERTTAPNEEFIHGWIPGQAVNSGGIELNDYDFERPRAPLNVLRNDPRGHGQDAWQQYEFPGGYTNDAKDGRLYARIRLEAEHAKHECCQGQSNVRGMIPGYKFNLKGATPDDQNREYLVRGCHYYFQDNAYASGTDDVEHQVEIAAHPSNQPFRPPRDAQKPRTTGPQTAVVTGPKGEEIYCDKYGRVKVHFHWDRHGSKDENSSCWIRVSNPWASSGFGGIQIPRINDEVIVDFLNGDPNYPIITGRVYNGEKMPPWDLPANATQMGLVSRSSPGGNPTTANALRFEDKKGSEEVWLHAEKDQRIEVEHDESHWVGNDRSKTIDGNETVTVHKNRTETVDQNETITIHQNRTETVDQDETITIHQNRTETVDQNETITIHQNRKERVDLNENISIGQNRTEDVGQNETVNIGANQTINVDGNKSETVLLGSMFNVGLAQMTNIGGAYVLDVGAGWMSNVGLMHMHNVGVKFSVNAGKVVSVSAGESASYDAGEKLTLQCGESMIVLESNGTITISGNEIKVIGEKHIDVDGKLVDIN